MNELLTAPFLDCHHVKAYADDSNIGVAVDRIDSESIAQCERLVSQIFVCGRDLGLRFNDSKTQVMIFSANERSASPIVEFRVDQSVIRSKDELIYLGVWITSSRIRHRRSYSSFFPESTTNESEKRYSLAPVERFFSPLFFFLTFIILKCDSFCPAS